MKRALKLCLIFLLLGVSAVASAATYHGVTLPDAITVNDKLIKLNGLGARTKTIFRIQIYVAGLYLETRSTNATRILAADTARRLELRMTHHAPRHRLVDEMSDGFARSTKGKRTAMKARIDQFLGALSDVGDGQALTLTYTPGRGTTLECAGNKPVTITGKDFADVAFSMWLGPDPFEDGLKRLLLGAS